MKNIISLIILVLLVISSYGQSHPKLDSIVYNEGFELFQRIRNASFEGEISLIQNGKVIKAKRRESVNKPIKVPTKSAESIKLDSMAEAYKNRQLEAQRLRKKAEEKDSDTPIEKEESENKWNETTLRIGEKEVPFKIILPGDRRKEKAIENEIAREERKKEQRAYLIKNADSIIIANRPRNNQVQIFPDDWLDSNYEFPNRSPATYHLDTLLFGVNKSAKHGGRFISMVTRIEGSYESISQKLDKDLIKNQTYLIGFYCALAERYYSPYPPNEHSKSFVNAVKINVFLANSNFERDQLIYSSGSNDNFEWKEHVIEFIPDNNFQYIIFEVDFEEGSEPYRGHILLDNVSDIYYKTE